VFQGFRLIIVRRILATDKSISTKFWGEFDARLLHQRKKTMALGIQIDLVSPRAVVRVCVQGLQFELQWARISGHIHPMAVLQSAGSPSSDCKQRLSVWSRDRLLLLLMSQHRRNNQGYRSAFRQAASTCCQTPYHNAISRKAHHLSPAPLFRFCMQRRSMVSRRLVDTPQA
jgi:hypothetical protein